MRRIPSLYRMPVAYLTMAVVLTSAVAWGRRTNHQSDGAEDVPNPLPTTSATKLALPPPVVKPTLPPPTADLILRTAQGVRRKVLVADREVFPRPTPDGDASSSGIAPSAIRFVLDETPTQLRIGSAMGGAEGWVPRASVVDWNSRLVARPTARSTRPGTELYVDRSCLASAVSGRPCPRHTGHCPGEVEDSDGGASGAGSLWAILDIATVPGGAGEPRTIYEVAPILAEETVTEPERLVPLRPALRQVFIAFVIDTTASMQPAIEAVRRMATDTAAAVTRRHADVTLHLGLVEYRDDAPGLGFKARVATPFTSAAGFRGIVGSLEAALREDDSGSESVLDGVALALPGTKGGLAWPADRAGKLATRLIVLVGDAPDHDRDLHRTDELAGRAREAGIAIATVLLDRPGLLSEEGRNRLEAQWRTLAASSYRPPGVSTAPVVLRGADAADLATRLGTLIEDRIKVARDMVGLAAAEDEGRLADYLAARGQTMVEVAPLLDAMRRGGLSPRRTRRKVPSNKRGWLAERMGDTRMVTVEALLSRDELASVGAELAALERSKTIESSEAMPIVNATALGELVFLDVDRVRLSLDDHRRRRSSLPTTLEVQGPWRVRLGLAVVAWSRLRDAPDAIIPGRPLAGYVAVPFGMIDF